MTSRISRLYRTSNLERLVERRLRSLDPIVAGVLNRALDGRELSVEDGVQLFKCNGPELQSLVVVADEMRQRAVGDVATFVVNRNINYTNVCYIGCDFCSFARPEGHEEAWFYPIEEITRRAREAHDIGATEVCIQGGLHPRVDPHFYIDLCKAIKNELPDIHIHAFSPWEVIFGSRKAHVGVEEYLKMLKEAGLGTMPGTAAEILDDEVRRVISPNKINTEAWVEVIKTAHRVGIPTTATIMYGHVDGPEHWAKHLALIRDIQKETGGFTEFIPLTFIHQNTELYKTGKARPGVGGSDDVKMYAVSRLMLHGFIRNIQVSWVKLGPKFAQHCLTVGANDFGGTLMNESISRMAGASHGQFLPVEQLVYLIRSAGRIPAQRTTTYRILKEYLA
ncbi:MAG: 5-amino-6-(D-ribitylamino)uracil--L-tyrosine 4-hydroxyphenyl transferase CofH [Candidatus Bathyarchaeia archaeon]